MNLHPRAARSGEERKAKSEWRTVGGPHFPAVGKCGGKNHLTLAKSEERMASRGPLTPCNRVIYP